MPRDLRRPFDIEDRLLPQADEEKLRQAIRAIYPTGQPDVHTLEDEVHVRHFWFRARYAEWMDSLVGLDGVDLLEVGGGTGTSSVAWAERGAAVTAIDLNDAALQVAMTRASLHGVATHFSTRQMNAAELADRFSSASFDVVVYSASLEHMTHTERMTSLRGAWSAIRPGGYLSVCDAPNRLWFHDNHTAMLNFFHWLPDDLAARYASRTPRSGFSEAFVDRSPSEHESLARWGRGVSYHDFEIALDIDVRELSVWGEWEWRRVTHPDWAEWWSATIDGQYHHLLRSIAPDIPVPFLDPEIAVIVQKPFA